MKCVCGYEHNTEEHSRLDMSPNAGNHPFIKIEGTFIVTGSYGYKVEVRLFACPVCDTVRMERY
jgi:hypothetical protein